VKSTLVWTSEFAFAYYWKMLCSAAVCCLTRRSIQGELSKQRKAIQSQWPVAILDVQGWPNTIFRCTIKHLVPYATSWSLTMSPAHKPYSEHHQVLTDLTLAMHQRVCWILTYLAVCFWPQVHFDLVGFLISELNYLFFSAWMLNLQEIITV